MQLVFILAALLAIPLLFYVIGPALVIALMPMPAHAKRGALLSLLDAAWRELLRMPFSATAPLAVALLIWAGQLKWGYERVGDKDGLLDALWGNNVRFTRSDGVFVGGINGDKFEWEPVRPGVGEPLRFPFDTDPTSADYAKGIALNYWHKGKHGRADSSRWVWLGLRNRSARLAQLLAAKVKAEAFDEMHGDPLANLDHPGWFAGRVGRRWQVHACLLVPGTRRLWRFNAGFKLRSAIDYGEPAHASNLLFSLRRLEANE